MDPVEELLRDRGRRDVLAVLYGAADGLTEAAISSLTRLGPAVFLPSIRGVHSFREWSDAWGSTLIALSTLPEHSGRRASGGVARKNGPCARYRCRISPGSKDVFWGLEFHARVREYW